MERDPATELTGQQAQAARLIALGTGFSAVAAELEVDRQTIWRWRHLPAFRQSLGCLSTEADEIVRWRIRSMMNAALDTVLAAMTDPDTPWTAKLTAAGMVFKLAEAWPPAVEVEVKDPQLFAFDPEVLRAIREQVYGLPPDPDSSHDVPELPGS